MEKIARALIRATTQAWSGQILIWVNSEQLAFLPDDNLSYFPSVFFFDRAGGI
ncbi:MAG: hypothetical protein H5U30_04215 [Marinobacter sp.]|nr:hypothetical protein [Marinobacter sp.]